MIFNWDLTIILALTRNWTFLRILALTLLLIEFIRWIWLLFFILIYKSSQIWSISCNFDYTQTWNACISLLLRFIWIFQAIIWYSLFIFWLLQISFIFFVFALLSILLILSFFHTTARLILQILLIYNFV
jgi:hypothetical protein